MYEPQKPYAKWRKPDINDYMLIPFIGSVQSLKKQEADGCPGLEVGAGIDCKLAWGTFRGDELDWGDVCTTLWIY